MLLGTKKVLSIVTNLTMDDPHHNPPPPHHHQTTPSHHHHHQRWHDEVEEDETLIRDIHALQPPAPPPSRNTASHRQPWDTTSHGSSSNSMSMTSDNFTTISREFSALVVAGSAIRHDPTAPDDHDDHHHHQDSNNHNRNMMLAMIGEGRDEVPDHETNPLAIVHQQDLTSHTHTPAVASPGRIVAVGSSSSAPVISVHSVKKEEIESKITAWQNAKVAKINNRFKREDAIIGGWENAQVERASASMKKVERKLEDKRARALEKMQNDVAKARRKAEEKRASAEAKRGIKVAKVYEICNLMRAVGRAPTKRSFF